MKSKKKVICLLIILIMIATAIRIYYINAVAVQPHNEYYSQNEWVDFGGSYFRGYHESTDGYSVRVDKTQLHTAKEYAEKYSIDDIGGEGYEEVEYIMEITITIRNEDNSDGYIMVGDWTVVGVNHDYLAFMNPDLLMKSDERINEYISSLTTPENLERQISLPFALERLHTEQEIENNEPFELIVTKYPMRNIVRVELDYL